MLKPLIATLALTASAAGAETYAIELGNRQIGTLQTSAGGLTSTLDNTPLGVADGTYDTTVSRVQLADGSAADQFLSRNRGSKTRDVSVIRQNSAVRDVTVVPADDATDLSDPTVVPANVLFPSEVFARLEASGGCPSPMSMYDGRRVVGISTAATAMVGGETVCDMTYRVTAGKGHLSPFNFKSLNVELGYIDGALSRVTVSAGGFDVNMVRR